MCLHIDTANEIRPVDAREARDSGFHPMGGRLVLRQPERLKADKTGGQHATDAK
jgi:hypothetical protein